MPTLATAPSLTTLVNLLRQAQRAVPATKYATGVVGIAAAAGIVNLILGHTRSSLILLVLMFIGMVVLFLFGRLVAVGTSPSIRAAANVVLWTIVFVFSATLLLGVSAVAARWPPGVVEFLFPKSELSISELITKVVDKQNIEEAEDAVTELGQRCHTSCEDRPRVARILASSIASTSHLDRELNVYIVRVLKQMFNGDLHVILDGKFNSTDIELVEVDFSNANLTGLDLSSLFVILTSFRNARLTDVDLSETSLRGSDFKNAIFDKTSLNNSDWYNALNLEKTQFDHIKGSVLKCPQPYQDSTFSAFIEAVNSRYGISYEHYGSIHQQQLKDQWKKYGASGGLCELAARQ